MDNIFLETERLILRKISDSDFAEISSMLKNPKIMYSWEYEFNDNDVQNWIDKNTGYYKKYNLGFFLLIEKETSTIVGQVALKPDNINGKKYYEIGYILKPEHWHKGFAQESAKVLANYAFNNLNLETVIFEIRPENTQSRKVAENLKANITGELIKNVRGKDMLHLIYTLNK